MKKPKIDDILSIVWSQHLESDYVCTLKHCPFCRVQELLKQLKCYETK